MEPIYVGTVSGLTIDITDLKPHDIITEDIARGLSYIRRYNGQTIHPWTVGQHMILCSMIADALGANEQNIKACFLHDVEEYLVQDLIYPIKNSGLVSEDFAKVSDNISEVIFKEFNCKNYDPKFVKQVDQIAYCFERTAFIPHALGEPPVDPEILSMFEHLLKELNFVIPLQLAELTDDAVANIINEHLIVFRAEKLLGGEISSDQKLLIEDMNKVWKDTKTHDTPNKVQ